MLLRRVGPLMLASILAWPLATFAQHPGDIPPSQEAGETPCSNEAASQRADCEAREVEREGLRARISREYHVWVADRLAEDGGARNLAIAAQLRAMSLSDTLYESGQALPELGMDPRVSSWVAQASREGQNDTLVLMLLNRRFSTSDDARLTALRTQWRRIDPDNFMPVMFEAEALASVVDTIPGLARGFSRYDVYWVEQMRAVIDAFERHPPTPDQASVLLEGEVSTLRRYAATVGSFMAEFPRFIDAIDACRGDALIRTAARRQDCRHLGELFADHSDTLIAHMMGLAILARATDDDAARAAIEARRRLAGWQMQRWQVLSSETPTAETEEVAMRALHAATDEMSLMQATLKGHGIQLVPPRVWKHVPLK